MKRILMFLIAIILLLAACQTAPAEAPPELENNRTAQEQVQEPQLALEPAPESVEHEMFDKAEIIAQFELVAEAVADIVDNFVLDIDAGMYPMSTLEEYAALRTAIGALGFPVSGGGFDMLNYQRVLEFWEDCSAGRDAQITIYSLGNTGIMANVYNHSGGQLYLLRGRYRFQTVFEPDNRPGVFYEGFNVSSVENLRLTENGWLIHPATSRGWDYVGFRVLPLGEENHALARRYLWGGAVPGGILAESWDSEDFSALSLPQVFATLYHQAGGFVTDDFLVDVIGGGSHDTAVLQVPADILEKLMLSRMPFTLEYLREHLPYSMGEYNFELPIISGGWHGWEVVDAVQNADGSRTLSVDAIDPNALEVWRSSILTVTSNPDGSIRYISHIVVTPPAT